MRSIEIVRIDPDCNWVVDAVHELYHADLDDAVISEFGSTVDAYRGFDNTMQTRDRLQSKFACSDPVVVGTIIALDFQPVGIAFSGAKDFVDKEGQVASGINMSGWVLPEYRGIGLGRVLFSEATDQIMQQQRSLGDSATWSSKRKIWTSIHQDNIASQKACKAAGYERSHMREAPREQDWLYLL